MTKKRKITDADFQPSQSINIKDSYGYRHDSVIELRLEMNRKIYLVLKEEPEPVRLENGSLLPVEGTEREDVLNALSVLGRDPDTFYAS